MFAQTIRSRSAPIALNTMTAGSMYVCAPNGDRQIGTTVSS